jgi:hypothetical protein
MGGVRQFAEDVSNALGLDGEITLDVQIITERIIQNRINEPSKARQAIESMRIGRDFRKLRDEIEWDRVQGYLCRQGVA